MLVNLSRLLHYNIVMNRNIEKYVFSLLFLLLCSLSFSSSRAIASNVNARANNDEILVTWDFSSSSKVSSFLIFRTSSPLASSQELNSLEAVCEVEANQRAWTDKVEKRGEDYYYAVIATVSGKMVGIVVPSVNATVISCRLDEKVQTQTLIERKEEGEKLYFSPSLREQPLPYMKKSVPEKSEAKIASDSVKNMFPLLPRTAQKKLPPYIFSEDREENAIGDDYLLQMILKRSFFVGDYKKASEELVRFLSVNREKGASDRAYFYIGECYYFSGDYKTALEFFLHTQNIYKELTRKWTRYTLNAFEIPTK